MLLTEAYVKPMRFVRGALDFAYQISAWELRRYVDERLRFARKMDPTLSAPVVQSYHLNMEAFEKKVYTGYRAAPIWGMS